MHLWRCGKNLRWKRDTFVLRRRFHMGVMHTGFPYRQETLLQNVLTLVHYHLVLCEGNKKSLSAGKPTGFWREGKLLSRKSKVKMIRINAPPFLRLAAVFPFIMGIWIGEIFCFAFSWPSVNLCTYYITFSPSCKPSFIIFFKIFMQTKTPWLLGYDVFDYLS